LSKIIKQYNLGQEAIIIDDNLTIYSKGDLVFAHRGDFG
jgi:hypothetical protein